MTAKERGRAGDNDPVRVAEGDVGAHLNEFVGKIHPGFIHPVVE